VRPKTGAGQGNRKYWATPHRHRRELAVRAGRNADQRLGVAGLAVEFGDERLALEKAEGVHFERAWLDPKSGKVFCLSTGPNEEAVMRVHEKAGHGTSEIYELPVEVA
jgi:hypothetical protein